jgi:hypothetical protein
MTSTIDSSRRCRVLALRDAAIHALGIRAGVAWIHREHPDLLYVSPAGAALASPRLAAYAYRLLSPFAPLGAWEAYLSARQQRGTEFWSDNARTLP